MTEVDSAAEEPGRRKLRDLDAASAFEERHLKLKTGGGTSTSTITLAALSLAAVHIA